MTNPPYPQQVPHARAGQMCPFHKVDVSKVCHKCPLWTQVTGKNPQSEETMNQWGCAFSLLPMLLIENAQQTRGTAAVMETFRNGVMETVVAMETRRRMALLPNQQ